MNSSFNPINASLPVLSKLNLPMKKLMQGARGYHDSALEEFMSLNSPEELDRTANRMMLAAKISAAMKAQGVGKKQFAEMMGQRPSVITKWLSGDHNFTTDTLSDIQRVLKIRLLALDEKPVQVKKEVLRVNLSSQVKLTHTQEILYRASEAFKLVTQNQSIHLTNNNLRECHTA